MTRALLLVVALAAVGACVAADDPSLDRWHYTYATIIAPRCATSACHSPLSTAGSLDLSDDATAYRELTGRACGDTTTAVAGYVDTAEPTASRLSMLLHRNDAKGMPPAQPLANQEIRTIEDWMKAGATCD